MSQLRDDLRRTTEQYREMNQALAQQQQQMTSLQVRLTYRTEIAKIQWIILLCKDFLPIELVYNEKV